MNTRSLLFCFCALGGVVGCRSVVGIEELSYDPSLASGDASSDAANSSDSGTDAAADAAIDECASRTGNACLKCCKDANKDANAKYEEFARDSGCLCKGAPCTLECAASICATTPSQAQPTQQCVTCVDDATRSGTAACMDARSTCLQSAQCRPLAECFAQCK